MQLQKSKPDCQPNVEYPGRILSGLDPENKGRYLVQIPELMYAIKDEGIYCVNHTHKWRNTETTKIDGETLVDGATKLGGSYYPLMVGTRVIVKFFAQDCSSGYIDRVISEHYSDSMPKESADCDNPRDDFYQSVRSKEKDIIAIKTSVNHKMYTHYYKKIDDDVNNNEKWVSIELTDEGLDIHSEKNIGITAKENIVMLSEKENIGISADKLIAINAKKVECSGCQGLKMIYDLLVMCCYGSDNTGSFESLLADYNNNHGAFIDEYKNKQNQ